MRAKWWVALGLLGAGQSAQAQAEGALHWPLPHQGRLTSAYAMRTHPVLGTWKAHYGVDLAAPFGSPIHAIRSGRVLAATRTPQYGYVVDIAHGPHLISRYAHASRLLVQVGDSVVGGAVIGAVGATGRATGPHLHLELFWDRTSIDPLRYFGAPAHGW